MTVRCVYIVRTHIIRPLTTSTRIGSVRYDSVLCLFHVGDIRLLDLTNPVHHSLYFHLPTVHFLFTAVPHFKIWCNHLQCKIQWNSDWNRLGWCDHINFFFIITEFVLLCVHVMRIKGWHNNNSLVQEKDESLTFKMMMHCSSLTWNQGARLTKNNLVMSLSTLQRTHVFQYMPP